MLRIFAIYDEKAQCSQQPFSVPTIGQAERAFQDACKDESTDLGKHPEDYTLYLVADYDPEKMEVTPNRQQIVKGAMKDGA